MLGVLDLAAALFKAVLPPITITNGNKTGVLLAGGGGIPSNFLVDVGAGGGATTIAIEESNDNSTYTPMLDSAGAAVSFAVVAGDANSTLLKTGLRTKKYVRAAVSSTSGTVLAGVHVIEGKVFAAPSGYEGGSQTNFDAN